MNVLLIHDHAHPAGGSELDVAVLRDGLRARGHVTRLFASRAGGAGDADASTVGTTGRGRGLLQSANPWAARDLAAELRAHRPDVVHLSMFQTQLSPLILRRLRGVPVVLRAEWYRLVCPTGHKLLPSGAPCEQRWGAGCAATGCLAAQDVVPVIGALFATHRWLDAVELCSACSEHVAAELRAGGLTDIPIEVETPGVPSRAARPPLVPPREIAIVGRLVAEKGPEDALEAFGMLARRHPDARLVVVGGGPLDTTLTQRARAPGLGDRVELTGRLGRREADARVERSWVQVVPSRWPEPFGLVAAEAMMRGTALIVSDSGGLREIASPQSGAIRVPPSNPARLAAAIDHVLSDVKVAERLGALGRREALRRFTLGRWIDQVEDQLVRTAAAGPRAAPVARATSSPR